MLARQIENGAPFDVFLSANEQFVMDLAQKGKIVKEDVQIYATGRIALWSKSGQIQSLEDLPKFKTVRLAIANPAIAPYGLAARQLLEKTGLWAKIGGDVVFSENVRQALQFAESGNVDAAIVAWSLVHDKGGVILPGDFHDPIRQVGAQIRKSKQRKAGRRFMDYLTGPEGKKLLSEHGLFVPTYTPSLKR